MIGIMKLLVFRVILCAVLPCLTQCGSRDNTPYFVGQLEYAYSYENDALDADSLAKEIPLKGILLRKRERRTYIKTGTPV
jgi:hypothetical protein